MGAWFALGLLIVAGIVLILSHDAGSIVGLEPSDFAALIAGLALVIYFGGSLFSGYRGGLNRAVRDAVLWLGVVLFLVTGYSYRYDLLSMAHRVAGELLPPGTIIPVPQGANGTKAVSIRRHKDGHFVARTKINKAYINLIVDTGASTVVLKPEDARRIGVNPKKLKYTVPVQTANGTSYAARVQLRSVSIGQVTARNVDALISRPGALHQSLLGMSFLSRLRSYEFSGDYLTLRSS